MSEPETKKSNWKHKYRTIKRQQEREEFADWSPDDFIDHILEVRTEFNALQDKYDVLKAPKPVNEIAAPVKKELKADAYKQEWSYPTKFVFLLTLENRPLKSLEIHNHLLKLDKHYKLYTDPKTTLSVYLRRVTKSRRILSVKIPGIREIYFAMPEWIDKENNFKDKYTIGTSFN